MKGPSSGSKAPTKKASPGFCTTDKTKSPPTDQSVDYSSCRSCKNRGLLFVVGALLPEDGRFIPAHGDKRPGGRHEPGQLLPPLLHLCGDRLPGLVLPHCGNVRAQPGDEGGPYAILILKHHVLSRFLYNVQTGSTGLRGRMLASLLL